MINRISKVCFIEKKRGEDGGVVQSVIFSKDDFSGVGECREWLRENGFTKFDVDEKENSYRFRQRSPGMFSRFITKKVRRGVSFVIGYK